MPSDSVTRIGIAVVESAGKYLIGVRGPEGPLPGYHEFPGGKLHVDESPEACALRECREETGLDVVAVERLSQVRHEYPHGCVELEFFLCRPVAGGHPAASGRFEWVPAADLPRLRFPEANAPVVERLVAARP
jgi:8-oxo-dGTP diphosphatase